MESNNISEEMKTTINLLASHERAIGQLYSAFSASQQDWEFWQQLSNQEQVHAQWLESILNTRSKYVVKFNPAFKPEAINQSIKYINEVLSRASTISNQDALACAIDLEQALIEKNYLDVFETESPEIERIFSDLKSETVKHQAMARREFSQRFPELDLEVMISQINIPTKKIKK